ncbi:hypothetical protein [Streptomyces shenzhenensis]
MPHKKALHFVVPFVLFSSLIPTLLTFWPGNRPVQCVEAAAHR